MRFAVRPLILATALVAGALAAVPASAAVLSSSSPATAVTTASSSTTSLCPDADTATFGPNVCVFTPTMTQAAIQADLNAISAQQVPVGAQFDSDRYAVFFEPGTYGSAADPLVFQVGYYTQVAGLGRAAVRHRRQRRHRGVRQPVRLGQHRRPNLQRRR